MNNGTVQHDRFDFRIDPKAGYARGRILTSPEAELDRLHWSWQLARQRMHTHGSHAFANFTGNLALLPIQQEDLALCDDWIGPAFVVDELHSAVLEHMGGIAGRDNVAILSRTSAAIFAWISLFGNRGTVISIVPPGGHGHSSIWHAAGVAGCTVIEVSIDHVDEKLLSAYAPSAAIITAVTSSLEEVGEADLRQAAATLRDIGCPTLLDDAYGSRIRPIVRGEAKSLQLGFDVAVTNADKAALGGPRCCMVAGDPKLVRKMATWAASGGLDARAPALVGLLRALQAFTPELLLSDIEDGGALSTELMQRFGTGSVVPSLLGPTIWEEDVHRMALDQADGLNRAGIRPCETTAAISMILLEHHGIVTVNAMSHPGSRVAFRLKPTTGSLAKVGGSSAFAQALGEALEAVGESMHDFTAMKRLIVGPDPTQQTRN